MRKLIYLSILFLTYINLTIADQDKSQARVGFHTDHVAISAKFTTEEMPEYIEGKKDIQSYVVYKLACPDKTAYQLSHLSSKYSELELEKKRYIQQFIASATKMGLEEEPITYPLQEEPSKGYYSYVTRGTLNNGLTLSLFSDFYVIQGDIFVVAQIKFHLQRKKQDLEEEKDLEFFQSVIIQKINLTPGK